MLTRLHVKNFALIEEEEINFSSGLNILSGETGAGKSIILGALSYALGGRAVRDVIRDESKEALVEAVFTVGEEEKCILSAMDISVWDDEVILTRKITGERSSAKINGETVPSHQLSMVGAYLIDIYGQHENQSLLNKKKHLDLLDDFAKDGVAPIKEKLTEAFARYKEKKSEYESANVDEAERLRELDFLSHEVQEIEEARIKPGEDAAVEEEYKRLSNSQKISEALDMAYAQTGSEGAAADMVGRALQKLHSVEEYDGGLSEMISVLSDLDGILSDFNRQISSYISDMDFAGERFSEVENRLNTLNHLKSKYGPSLEDVLAALSAKQEKIEKLVNYDAYLTRLKKELDASEAEVGRLSDQLSVIRQQASVNLCALVRDALLDLNFLDVRFDMKFDKTESYGANGTDAAEFLISTNPGEPVRPLKDIASGGELSRVMLAIKTILAKSDAIDTLIFDEIDAGISGRTAQAVSEKIYQVSTAHQVILITHLPQIAAMADHHFLIEKDVVQNATISSIQELYGEQITKELARMVGGAEITAATMENARELKTLADGYKERGR